MGRPLRAYDGDVVLNYTRYARVEAQSKVREELYYPLILRKILMTLYQLRRHIIMGGRLVPVTMIASDGFSCS